MSFAARGIVVTRPRELAQPLAAAIERRGGRAIVFPAIEIEELPAPAALKRLSDYQLVIFVSPTAVRVSMRAIGPWPPTIAAAAIGAGTRRELERAAIASVIAPQAGADSEALLALPEMRDVAGKRVLIVRGESGRPMLGNALGARGAAVEYAECYRRSRPVADAAPLVERWKRREVDAVTVSSAEGFDNLLAMTGTEGAALLAATPLFVPHPRIASHVRMRVSAEVVVAGPGDDELVERLVAYFDGRT
jgi:uroporphyrinogen-III synthase